MQVRIGNLYKRIVEFLSCHIILLLPAITFWHYTELKKSFKILLFQLGSVSAHLHVLSPASKGLFQRAILVSGTANCPWAFTQQDQVPGLLQFGIQLCRFFINIQHLITFSNSVLHGATRS